MDDLFWFSLVLAAWAALMVDIWRSPLSEAPTLAWLTCAVLLSIPTAVLWLVWGRWRAHTWVPRWPTRGG